MKTLRTHLRDPWSAATAAAVFLFLIWSLSQIRTYSRSMDELNVMERARLSMTLLSSDLGLSSPVSDSERSLFKGLWHPPFYGILNTLASRFARAVGFDPVESNHLFGIFFSAFGLWMLFLLTRKVFDAPTGFLAVLCLIGFPRFIAHAHYNLKDIPLMVGSVISIFFMIRLLEMPDFASAIYAGLSIGLASAFELNELLLIPGFLLAVGVKRWKLKSTHLPKFAALAVVVSFLSLWAVWPLSWSDPFFIVSAIRSFSSKGWWDYVTMLYFGKRYPPADFPWHFTPMHVFFSTPVPVFLAALAGIFLSFRIRQPAATRVLLLSWLLVPILVRSRTGVVRYDEMRHVFMCIPPLMIYAGVGLRAGMKAILSRRSPWAKPVGWTLFGLFFLHLILEIACFHPFEGSYYNEAVRFFIPSHIENYFPIATWGTTCRQAVDWANQNAEPNSQVCVDCEGTVDDYEQRKDLKFTCDGSEEYLIMGQTRKPAVLLRVDLYPLATVSRAHSDFIYIFKSSESFSARQRDNDHTEPATEKKKAADGR